MPSNGQKLNEWRIRIEQWEASQKTIAAWCQEQAVAVQTFYYWRKRVNEAFCAHRSTQSGFIQLKDEPGSESGNNR